MQPSCSSLEWSHGARLSSGTSPAFLEGGRERRPGAHLLSGLRLVDDADDPPSGTLALLPADGRGQQREPGVPEVSGGQHDQGAAPREAPKPGREGLTWTGVGAEGRGGAPRRLCRTRMGSAQAALP